MLFVLFDMSKLVGFEKGDLLPADDANNTRERERVIVIMPDDDLQDASASEEPVVLVETEGVETTTQPKIIVPPFGAFRKGINLLSKAQRIKALWKEYEKETAMYSGTTAPAYYTPVQWSCTVAGCDCGTHDAAECIGGLEYLIDGGINES